MSSNVYKVIDTCVDTNSNTCYLYVRDSLRKRFSIRLRPLYEILVGCSSTNASHVLKIIEENLSSDYQVLTNILKSRRTYCRGVKDLLRVICPVYSTYSTVLNKLKYNYDNCFLCESYCTIEDKTLMKHGIYGASYVYCDGSVMRAATERECFNYTPIIAGIDLEMLSLNPVDPSCILYMASYYCYNRVVVIYTQDYCTDISNDDIVVASGIYKPEGYEAENIIYIRVANKYELVKKLSDVIAHESPDVVTGYNIYAADFPLLYFTIRSSAGNWTKMCEGPEPYFLYTKKLDRGFADSEAGLVVKIPGCHVIDMYYFLDESLPSEDKNSLKLGDVSAKYLGASKDAFTYRDLDRIYHNGNIHEKIGVMFYCIKDSYLAVQLYNKFNVWNYYDGVYSISGVNHQKSSCTGIVDVTHGMCYIRTKQDDVYIDDPNNSRFIPGGGLVLDGSKGMWDDVLCIDFNSLYPNITIEYNIDSLSVINSTLDEIVAKYGLMKNMNHHLESHDGRIIGLYDGKGSHVFFDRSIKAVIPSILKELLSEREELKKLLNKCDKNSLEYLVISGQEQARKKAANGACGAFAEKTPGSPLSYCVLNDVITATGRSILRYSQMVASSNGIFVVYGDTDSLMIKSCDNVNQYIDMMHSILPSRIRFKIEYVAKKFIMGGKKHYIAEIVNSDGSTKEIKISGYKAVKSSSCKMAQQVFRWLIDKLLHEGSSNIMTYYLQILEYHHNSQDIDSDVFSYRFSYTGKSYEPGNHRYNLISNMTSRNVELIAGNTLAISIVKTLEKYTTMYPNKQPPIQLPHESQGIASRVYTLDEIGNNRDVIDTVEILEKQCGSDIRSIMRYILPPQTLRELEAPIDYLRVYGTSRNM